MSKASTLASETVTIAGVWHPAGSSRAMPATLSTNASGVAVTGADGVEFACAPLDLVDVSVRVGSIPRRLSFPDQSLFETPDNDAVDRLCAKGARGAGLVHELERFRPRLFVFAALVVGLCFLIYRFAVPLLVEVAVAVTPPVVPQLLSKGALSSLDSTMLDKSTLPPERQAALTAAFRALAATSERGANGYVLNFRKGGSLGPNALALPDGNIVVTDELVELATDDEAVLGVLAHEIGHVEHEHTLRQLYRAAGIAALVMMIGGDIGSGVEDILVQGSALVALSYSRGQESEADRYSVELMTRAGKNPAAIVRFLELMNDRLGKFAGPSMLSTHPATPERIEAVKRYAEEFSGTD